MHHAVVRHRPQASCPLSPWAKPAREDLMVVFRMNETALMFGDVDRASAAWERVVVVADALPRGSDYVLQFVNCENVGNYTSGADGDSPSALSMELEVRPAPCRCVRCGGKAVCASAVTSLQTLHHATLSRDHRAFQPGCLNCAAGVVVFCHHSAALCHDL